MEAYQWLRLDNNGIGTKRACWEQVGPSFKLQARRYAVLRCCQCDTHFVQYAKSMSSGRSKMCFACMVPKHGMALSPEYKVWRSMRHRCSNPKAGSFERYGGRGITVCSEWSGSNGFSAFYSHVGARPSPRHQLDRIDTSGHYAPGNVRWATPAENQRNKPCNVTLTIDGVSRCIAEWAEQPGAASHQAIYKRVRWGWSPNDAVFGKFRLNYKRSKQ